MTVMSHAGSRGWRLERRPSSPRRPRADRSRARAEEGTKSLSSRLRGMQFCRAAPGSEQKLQAGVKQPPTGASQGTERAPTATRWRGRASRPQRSPNSRKPCSALSVGRSYQAYLFVCCNPGKRDRQYLKWAGSRGGGQNFPGAREGHSQRETRPRG